MADEKAWNKGMAASWERLEKEVTEESWKTPNSDEYGESISNHWKATTESTGDLIQEELGVPLQEIGGDAIIAVDNLAGMAGELTGVFDEEQYANLADAGTSAALDYLTQKIKRIRTLWNTLTPVSVGTMLDEIAPFATDWSVAIKLLGDRCSSMVAYILDVDNPNGDWKQLGLNISDDALKGLLNNPEMQQAIGNLSLVKAFADGLGAITSAVDVAKDAMAFLEPWAPTISILSDLIEAARGNPQAAVESGATAQKLGLQFLYDTYRLGMKYARKLLFNMTFDVPQIIVGSLSTLSVKSAVAKFDYETNGNVNEFNWGNEALATLFADNDFYNTTPMTPEWRKALGTLNKFQNDVKNNAYLNGKLDTYSKKSYGASVLAKLTTTVLDESSKRARKVAHVPNFSGMEWLSPEAYIKAVTKDRTILNPLTETLKSSYEVTDVSASPITDEKSIQQSSKYMY